MTTRTALLLALLALAATAACSAQKLPGTDIRDEPESRAIYAVIDAYVQALNKRDAAGVLAQVAPDYFDDAGTPEPGDDLDRPGLEKALGEDLARLEAEKLAVSIRKIEVEPGGLTAFAEVFYDNWYRVQTPTGLVPRRDTDVHRLRFRKVEASWRIVSGL